MAFSLEGAVILCVLPLLVLVLLYWLQNSANVYSKSHDIPEGRWLYITSSYRKTGVDVVASVNR